MATDSELNQFRRYIGDYDKQKIDDATVEDYLDDATREATSAHITPDDPIVIEFDKLNPKYRPEVIILAAINYWWNKAADWAAKLTTSMGSASEQASDRYQHALQMIDQLQQRYDNSSVLGQSIDLGNLSRFDRWTLQRYGGQREEDAINAASGDQ